MDDQSAADNIINLCPRLAPWVESGKRRNPSGAKDRL